MRARSSSICILSGMSGGQAVVDEFDKQAMEKYEDVVDQLRDRCEYGEGFCRNTGKEVYIDFNEKVASGVGAVCLTSRLFGATVMIQGQTWSDFKVITLTKPFQPCIEDDHKNKDNFIVINLVDGKNFFGVAGRSSPSPSSRPAAMYPHPRPRGTRSDRIWAGRSPSLSKTSEERGGLHARRAHCDPEPACVFVSGSRRLRWAGRQQLSHRHALRPPGLPGRWHLAALSCSLHDR